VNRAEELEETAKLHFLLLSSGKPVRYFTDREIDELATASGRK
jgi:ribulose-5-phosphate 4-epimerase/fuculose-1-phosphate aldolase